MSDDRRENGSIAFQPRARLLKLIGEELISDEVVAISELVKNAHDADARSGRDLSRGDQPTGIVVRDDGHGMDSTRSSAVDGAGGSTKGGSARSRRSGVGCSARRASAGSPPTSWLATSNSFLVADGTERRFTPSSTGTSTTTTP